MAAAAAWPKLGQRTSGAASSPHDTGAAAPGGAAAASEGTWLMPDTTAAEAKRRDGVMRRNLLDRDWEGPHTEFALQRAVVQCSSGAVDAIGVRAAALAQLVARYPLIIGHEWEFVDGEMHNGKGDFLLASADGGDILVLETKVLPRHAKSGSKKNMRTTRTSLRKKLKEQVVKYMKLAAELYPHATVHGASLATKIADQPGLLTDFTPLAPSGGHPPAAAGAGAGEGYMQGHTGTADTVRSATTPTPTRFIRRVGRARGVVGHF